MKNSIMKISGKKEVDMTEGNILGHLISFALPLLLGNIFQQLYNAVDTWVVGNYISNEAFSAVGTVGPAVNMLIGLFTGLSSGISVVIAHYYGAQQYEKVHTAVHTALAMTIVLAVVCTGLSVAAVPSLLTLMKVPAEVFPESRTYLTIYFAGVVGLVVYNIGSGILRAVGDSTRPFYFLVVAAVVNTVLDLLFVIGFGMGVEGVAYATIIAQGISAILILITLSRSGTCIELKLRDLKVDWQILIKIVQVGIPAALQLVITSFSNIFVQSYINYFGADSMSGWTAYSKVDQLMFLPMQSIAMAVTTFVGQNLGKAQTERAKTGIRKALWLAMGVSIILLIPIELFAPYTVAFFNDKAEVVACGTMLLRCISPFYVACTINQIYAAALRGVGQSHIPMIIMLTSFVFFRQCYLYVMANYISNEMLPIAMGYPAGWILCSTLILIYYKKKGLTAPKSWHIMA